MKPLSKKMLIIFVVVTILGACLHFLYAMFPNPVTALVSPINESLWEHLKILFWPYLVTIFILTKGGEKGCKTPWFLSLLLMSALMLALGYVYHVLMSGSRLAVDVGIYVLLMAAGFVLPTRLHRTAEKSIWRDIAAMGVIALTITLILFTFLPPDSVFFIDLSGVNTFARIPC